MSFAKKYVGPQITIKEIAYHRNGVCGAPFHAVLFDDVENGGMVASLFEEEGHCAVYNVDQLKAGNIAFAMGNSWRGDHYEPLLRQAVQDAEAKAEAKYRND